MAWPVYLLMEMLSRGVGMQKDTKGHEKSFIAFCCSYPCWLEHSSVLASHSWGNARITLGSLGKGQPGPPLAWGTAHRAAH